MSRRCRVQVRLELSVLRPATHPFLEAHLCCSIKIASAKNRNCDRAGEGAPCLGRNSWELTARRCVRAIDLRKYSLRQESGAVSSCCPWRLDHFYIYLWSAPRTPRLVLCARRASCQEAAGRMHIGKPWWRPARKCKSRLRRRPNVSGGRLPFRSLKLGGPSAQNPFAPEHIWSGGLSWG